MDICLVWIPWIKTSSYHGTILIIFKTLWSHRKWNKSICKICWKIKISQIKKSLYKRKMKVEKTTLKGVLKISPPTNFKTINNFVVVPLPYTRKIKQYCDELLNLPILLLQINVTYSNCIFFTKFRWLIFDPDSWLLMWNDF